MSLWEKGRGRSDIVDGGTIEVEAEVIWPQAKGPLEPPEVARVEELILS